MAEKPDRFEAGRFMELTERRRRKEGWGKVYPAFADDRLYICQDKTGKRAGKTAGKWFVTAQVAGGSSGAGKP